MAVAFSISVEGLDELRERLDRINPKRNPAPMIRALKKAGMLIQDIASNEKIKRGGRVKKGSRMTSAAPIAGRLTSRTGMLRRSIRMNQSPLPFAIEVGTDLAYGAVHETGGTFGKPSRMVASHTRKVAFGRKVAPFKVPSHFRSGHYAEYPARPFLGPALDDVAPRLSDIFANEIAKELK